MAEKSWQRTLVGALLRYRLAVLAVIALISLFVLSPFVINPKVLFEQKQGKVSAQDDSGRDLISMAKKFGQGEPLLLIIEADDIFTADNLALVQKLTSSIKQIDGVMKVESLTTVKDLSVDEYGEMGLKPLFAAPDLSKPQLDQIKKEVLANPMWAGTLLSFDGKVTVINITLPPLTRGMGKGAVAVSAINSKMSELNISKDVKVYLTGLTPLLTDSSHAIETDFKRFFWLTWAVMVVLLFFAFRTVRGVLLPLGITMLAVGWTLGIMALLGETLSSVGAMLPSMIAIVCFSDAVHVLAHYYEHAKSSRDRTEIIVSTMENMLTACFLTSLTTAAAFLTLAVSDLSNIRQLGLWSSFGILIGYILIAVMMPLVLSFLSVPPGDVLQKYRNSLFTKVITFALFINRRHSAKVVAICALLLVFAGVGINRIKVETSMVAFLPEEAPSIQGLTIVQKKLLGFGTVEMEVKGPKNCFEQPWALLEIQKIEHFLEARQDVGTVTSIVDLFQWIFSKLEHSDENVLTREHAEGLISEILFMLGGTSQSDQLSALLADDNSVARVSARLKIAGTGEQIQLLDDLNNYIETNVDKRLQVVVTGDSARMSQQIISILESLTNSFFITLAVIFFLMLWLLRSLKGAIISMVPNILPVVLTMGVMGGLGLSLNFATAMISSIAIGISVDNTIHVLIRYSREIRDESVIEKALENTIWSTGRALMFTSVVMGAGCGLFVLSDFAPIKSFGGLMVLTIFTALMMDMFILPWMIRFFRLKF